MMWKTSYLDWVLLCWMAGTSVAFHADYPLTSCVLAFCAGNQCQICIAGAWWKVLRSLWRLNRDAAIEKFEEEME